MLKPDKISFAQLKCDMQVFLDFPQVENLLLAEAGEIVDRVQMKPIPDYNADKSPIAVLERYLTSGSNIEERLKTLIGLTGGSLERVKRIFEAIFPNNNWGQFRTDTKMHREIFSVLLDPHSASIFIPEFIQQNIALPNNWVQMISDKDYLLRVILNNLQSKYSVRIGNALEEAVRQIVVSAGWQQDKGAVEVVDGKEIDIAVPNLESPQILIMSSYNLTTSSSQTSRSNEQLRMYDRVRTANRHKVRKKRPPIFFINVIDGGGWLQRPNDLKKMWDECDYCFCYKNLHGLKEVLDYAFA